ncbi:thioredoxin [Lactonifactor longoviformis]|uniref:Thioredoxin n=1 Tax=Lactonifactor longoviformis DSM 17459 TaxID=1122155 RepID=A0A1M4WEU2_9CLOT|nr:thioredoxin [Lactonifactor longoviformis]POP30345.1 thioredoxin [Lactonifactor longoviformis]SHE79705.1 thioredoxin [Lactonifactor longoviformis DSM 17459]
MVKVLNEENFETEVMGAGKAALVDFYADWCGPCKMMAPVVEELSEEYKEKAVFGKVNVDENPSLAQKYGVMSIPTFVILKDGQVAGKAMGAIDKKELEEKLDAVL